MSLMGGDVDTARDNQVRDALTPLAALAQRRRVAVVGVLHLRKADAERVLYRVGGSVGGFVGLARSVLLVAQDPETGRRAVAHIKCNVGPLCEPVEFTIDHEGFQWLGVAPELTADRLLGPAPREESKPKLEKAKDFLLEALCAGPREASDVLAEGDERGHSEKTMRRAAKDLGVAMGQLRVPGHRGAGPSWWGLDHEDLVGHLSALRELGQPNDEGETAGQRPTEPTETGLLAQLPPRGSVGQPNEADT
jgi:hypothetical protein